jgi:hypothetical protein
MLDQLEADDVGPHLVVRRKTQNGGSDVSRTEFFADLHEIEFGREKS